MGRKLLGSILAVSLALTMSLVTITPAQATTTFTLLDVTSLADTPTSGTDPGTLRWAITQANATTANDYGKITFSVTGTITLTSDLPRISRNLTIEGPGQNALTISGNDLYQIFYINPGITLTASDLALSDGKQVNGGMVYGKSGIVFNSTDMKFSGQPSFSSAVFMDSGLTVTFTRATFLNNSVGIRTDYGFTPQLPVGVTTWVGQPDSVFNNRTYVYDSTFEGNDYAIFTERFTLIDNSTFLNNNYGAVVRGLNRTQISNSTFEGNSLIAYYNLAVMPTPYSMGTDNRLIQNNIFKNNGTAISNNDRLNNGQFFPGGSTYLDNTFEGNTENLSYQIWDGTANQVVNLGDNLTTTDFVLLRSTIVGLAPPPTTPDPTVPAYSGPIIEAAVSGFEFAPGSKVSFSGSRLSGVTSGSISGLDALLTVVSDSELEITVPTGLESGTYDLVLVSDSGRLTVQSALKVKAPTQVLVESGLRVLSKSHSNGMVKTYAMDVVGAGKVQFYLNGKEIAWVRASDNSDPKLRFANGSSYLVRTIELVAGQKNVIEIYVDGERVDRKVYTR